MRPNAQRARSVIVLLWILLAIQLISLCLTYLRYEYATSVRDFLPSFVFDIWDRVLLANAVVKLLNAAISLAIIVVFICWFRRAYYNLHLLTDKLSFKEGWAAGAWFVPFLNLVRPYRIMKEMVEESQELLVDHKLADYNDARVRRVRTWWTFWIVNFIVTRFILRAELMSPTLETQIKLSIATMIMAVFGIIMILVTVRMINDYRDMEKLLPLVQKAEGRAIVLNDSDILDSI